MQIAANDQIKRFNICWLMDHHWRNAIRADVQHSVGPLKKDTWKLLSYYSRREPLLSKGTFAFIFWEFIFPPNPNRDVHGNTPLLYSALGGQIECVKYFLTKGSKINEHNNTGCTAFLW